MKHAYLIIDPDQKFAAVLEMIFSILHHQESKYKKKRCHFFTFFLPREISLYSWQIWRSTLWSLRSVQWKNLKDTSHLKWTKNICILYLLLKTFKMDVDFAEAWEMFIFSTTKKLSKLLVLVLFLYLNIILLLKIPIICICSQWLYLLKGIDYTAYAFWENVHSKPTLQHRKKSRHQQR